MDFRKIAAGKQMKHGYLGRTTTRRVWLLLFFFSRVTSIAAYAWKRNDEVHVEEELCPCQPSSSSSSSSKTELANRLLAPVTSTSRPKYY